ncbi:DUF4124 domain-containing protein [Frateuria hangzhouensis]|uniref:DUF4124 domain-containing protein n=1 Tax=Frateuria hangzhouensis TaxID=2995589 RepID=UPI002260E64C|nr:DUF4124 domain-containing protein [Frateuria sp. STR12]MCX7513959.1 DUF4124 domain-containing protein [Frateuria sp. STR12]
MRNCTEAFAPGRYARPMPTLRLVLLLLLALTALPGHAQSPIYHCIAADGHPVFTDQPCSSLQATAAPATAASASAPSLRPPAVTCAADVDALRGAVIDAFANADANRLAGLILWAGYGEHAAVADIRALAGLMRRPLVGIDLPDDGSASDGTAALVVRTVPPDGSDDPGETRFAIERHAGCLWLRQE